MAITIEDLEAAGIAPDAILAAMKVSILREEREAAEILEAKRRADRERKQQKRASINSSGNAGIQRTSPETADENQVIDFEARAATTPRGQETEVNEGVAEATHIDRLTTLSSSEGSKERKKEVSVITRARPGTRLPIDWTLSETDRDFARTVLPEARITIEFDKFRDHWASSARPSAVKRDWSAAWRNWCRNATENGGQNGSYRQGRNGSPVTAAIDARIAHLREAAARDS